MLRREYSNDVPSGVAVSLLGISRRQLSWLVEEGREPVASKPCFISSACWRNIAPGILSATRFVGILLMEKKRLAVCDIGDEKMEWQIRAEGSLFYTRYGSYEARAAGMLLVCHEKPREQIAENNIRQTMW